MIKIEKPDPKKIDEIKQWEIWEKEPCTFDHDQQKTESFYIIEGKASLSTDKGINVDISAGNLVTVESGQMVHWHVHETIKKHFRFYD